VVNFDTTSHIRSAEHIRDYGVSVLLSFLGWDELAVRPKDTQLYRLSALSSLLSDGGAYMFGLPSLPAIDGFLTLGDSANIANRRDSRNALSVTHFGIVLGLD